MRGRKGRGEGRRRKKGGVPPPSPPSLSPNQPFGGGGCKDPQKERVVTLVSGGPIDSTTVTRNHRVSIGQVPQEGPLPPRSLSPPPPDDKNDSDLIVDVVWKGRGSGGYRRQRVR